MRNHITKRIFLWVLTCMLLLLCGCGQTPPVTETNPPTTGTEPTTGGTEPTTTEALPPEPIELVRDWLELPFSFQLSYMYMDLGSHGNSQDTNMIYAEDGSYSMVNQHRSWDHRTGSESEEVAEFYYRYEGSDLVCYMRINDPQFSRSALSDADIKAMDRDRPRMAGAPAIVPDYLQDLSLTETANGAVFTYSLPLKDVLDSGTILAVFVQNAFNQSGEKYDPATNLTVGCTLETDPETYQPRSFSFDFTEIKPYVLSDGALSGEYALQTDFMTMSYTFDYTLADTVTVPDTVIPEMQAVLVQQQYLKTAEKCDYGSLMKKLSHEEQVFYITQTLDTEVNNGGFWQFLYNAEKEVFTEVVTALEELGAAKTADLCRDAFDAFGEKLPTSRTGRSEYLDKLGLDRYYALLLDFDNAYLDNDEDLTALAYAYITEHQAAFS